MLSIFKKSLLLPDLGAIGTDIHAHWLPALDDGAGTLTESFTLLRGLHGLGLERCWATPHISQEHYPNSPAGINEAYQRMVQVAPDFVLNHSDFAAEYLVDGEFLRRTEQGNLLTLPNNRLLFEFSFAAPPDNLSYILFTIQVCGYKPVVAHPERYRYWSRNPDVCRQLVDSGCELQINMLSLLGYYGKSVRRTAYEIIETGGRYLLGSDCHNARQLACVASGLKDRQFTDLVKRGLFTNKSL